MTSIDSAICPFCQGPKKATGKFCCHDHAVKFRNLSRRNPIKDCCLCLRKVGFGYTFIQNRTATNKSLVRKWCKKSGLNGLSKRSPIVWGRKKQPITVAAYYMQEIKRPITIFNRLENHWHARISKPSKPSTPKKRALAVHMDRHRRNTDPAYRAKFYARKRVREFIKRCHRWKRGMRVSPWIGCSAQFLAAYIAAMFRDGMTWQNHGKHWEIDHIIPLSSADMTDMDNVLRLSHYTNLQPLLVRENRIKGDKIIGSSGLIALDRLPN